MPDVHATDNAPRELEIGHVLFVDIVGYSKRLLNEQTALVKRLNNLVRGTGQFKKAEASGKLITIPTGDGVALVFFTTPDAPVRCAIEINQADKDDPKIEVRMGIHSGPIDRVADVNEQANVAGAGINMAQRVMGCGDSGHILLSRRLADDLAQDAAWQSQLHDLGEIEVKHGVRLGIYNLYSNTFGNPSVPEKVRTAQQAQRQQGTRKKLLLAGVGVLLLATLVAGTYLFLLHRTEQNVRTKEAEVPARSIAVLPFENLSSDKENAFLATGLQDEILTQLAKIGSLKVISRTSTMQYESKPKSVAKIAAELGVAAILEGSVQKAGNSIRVNVQLIKAATDEHLWAEKYDRELIDMLKVQSDIAQQVATALSATLTKDEKTRLEQKATNNPEAYALYLKGTEVLRRPAIAAAPMEEGQHDFEQAVALDPNFALAHARLAQIHTRIAIFFDPSAVHKERGRAEAEEGLRLQPHLSEGHLALGLYFGRLAREYDAALREYELAREGAPNDVYILYGIAHVQMKRGQWRAATTQWERATALDPLNWNMHSNLANAYAAVGLWPAAERSARRAVELLPGKSPFKVAAQNQWAAAYYDLTGSWDKFREIIALNADQEDPAGYIAASRFDVHMAEHNYAAAEKAITDSPASIIEIFTGPRLTKNFFFGVVAMAQGDMAKARPFFEAELQFARNEVIEAPESEARHAQLGLICAYLGQKGEAIAEGQRAIDLMPVSKDAFDGPNYLVNQAEIYARLNEPDKALDLIEQLLTTPNALPFQDLKLWHWDPLRSHPRFQKLLNGPPPKIQYR